MPCHFPEAQQRLYGPLVVPAIQVHPTEVLDHGSEIRIDLGRLQKHLFRLLVEAREEQSLAEEVPIRDPERVEAHSGAGLGDRFLVLPDRGEVEAVHEVDLGGTGPQSQRLLEGLVGRGPVPVVEQLDHAQGEVALA